jgi:hypothetical protein
LSSTPNPTSDLSEKEMSPLLSVSGLRSNQFPPLQRSARFPDSFLIYLNVVSILCDI